MTLTANYGYHPSEVAFQVLKHNVLIYLRLVEMNDTDYIPTNEIDIVETSLQDLGDNFQKCLSAFKIEIIEDSKSIGYKASTYADQMKFKYKFHYITNYKAKGIDELGFEITYPYARKHELSIVRGSIKVVDKRYLTTVSVTSEMKKIRTYITKLFN